MTRPLSTLATPAMLQLRAAVAVACSWLFGSPARLTGWLVAYRITWDWLRATLGLHGRRRR